MEELVDLERRGWDSLCEGRGADFYGEVMTTDGCMVLAGGTVLERDEVVDSLRGSPAWDGYDITDTRVRRVGEDAATLVYTGTGYRAGRAAFQGVMTSVYVRLAGTWRLALYQQTPLG